jgi:hypothetical protein
LPPCLLERFAHSAKSQVIAKRIADPGSLPKLRVWTSNVSHTVAKAKCSPCRRRMSPNSNHRTHQGSQVSQLWVRQCVSFKLVSSHEDVPFCGHREKPVTDIRDIAYF